MKQGRDSQALAHFFSIPVAVKSKRPPRDPSIAEAKRLAKQLGVELKATGRGENRMISFSGREKLKFYPDGRDCFDTECYDFYQNWDDIAGDLQDVLECGDVRKPDGTIIKFEHGKKKEVSRED